MTLYLCKLFDFKPMGLEDTEEKRPIGRQEGGLRSEAIGRLFLEEKKNVV